MTEQRSGQRFEIVVLKIHRNDEGSVKELYALENYLKSKGEKYTVMCATYGSPSKALKKTIAWYLDEHQLKHPIKTLYEINKMFVDRKMAKSIDIADMGVQSDIEKLTGMIAGFFGKDLKKPEDLEDDENL